MHYGFRQHKDLKKTVSYCSWSIKYDCGSFPLATGMCVFREAKTTTANGELFCCSLSGVHGRPVRWINTYYHSTEAILLHQPLAWMPVSAGSPSRPLSPPLPHPSSPLCEASFALSDLTVEVSPVNICSGVTRTKSISCFPLTTLGRLSGKSFKMGCLRGRI